MPSLAPKKPNFRAHAVAALVAVWGAIVMTWPLARNAGGQILRAPFFWDAYTNAMIMGSRVDAVLGRSALGPYDDYFFAPLPHSIAFNENHFGLSLLFAPFYLLGGNPLWAYNATLLTSLSLSVFFTYLFVRRLTQSAPAALLSGVAFAFSSYVLFELGRLQLVATQWIPLSFLLLHRSIEGRRTWDIVGFWLCILLQVGTCLYYTMFLIPLLGLVALVLLAEMRPPLRFYGWFGAGALVTGVVSLLMVRPYFAARRAFELERSLEFASGYDGKFSFFANVPPTNLSWTALHHEGEFRGAYEEIAFPGLSILLLLGVGLLVPAWQSFRGASKRRSVALVLRWLGLLVTVAVLTLASHSMLVGVVTFGVGLWLFDKYAVPHPFHGRRGLYLAVLLLAVVMFLGLTPFEWRGEPVRGLYYYFHTYFPGFNGIRKVSRQAVMTTFAACVLAGFGGAWLFSKVPGKWAQSLLSLAIGATLTWELRAFPHPIEPVWGNADVPKVLEFARTLPPQDLVASTPQNAGTGRFRGDAGMALHNYLALYHKHRFVNGQSSYQLPVTDLALTALQHLPDDGARRILTSIGVRHIIVFGDELPPERRNLSERLLSDPKHYRRVFADGADSVFSLVDVDDPELQLLETPLLPPDAQRVPRQELYTRASLETRRSGAATDGDERTRWTGGRPQARGQYFEVTLEEPQAIAALEIQNPGRVMDVPNSFSISTKSGSEPFRTVARQGVLRLFRDQVYSPKTFVFRVVLLPGVIADTIRVTVEQPVPGRYFSIYELAVYAQ